MQVPWQNLIALALVAAAVGYLGWRAWRLLAGKSRGGCEQGCSGCAESSPGPRDQPAGFVSIEQLRKPPHRG